MIVRMKAFVGIIVNEAYDISMLDVFNASDLLCILLIDGPPVVVIAMGVERYLLFYNTGLNT